MDDHAQPTIVPGGLGADPVSSASATAPTGSPGGWFTTRYAVTAVLATAFVALILGIPTDVIPNPWFTRMIEAEPLNYFFWIGTSLVSGALLATYVLPKPKEGGIGIGGAGLGSGMLGLLAVGCPICNKLVIALLGVSGALNYFAPIQPLLGGLGLLLATSALLLRIRGARRACAVPVPSASS